MSDVKETQLEIRKARLNTTGGYGAKEFWTVVLDSIPRWLHAEPFSSDTERLVLDQCTECYMCGAADALVRRVGSEHVVWIGDPDREVPPAIAPGEPIVFASENYQRAIGAGDVDALPLMSDREIRGILSSQRMPDPAKALYREPDSIHDVDGRLLLTVLQDMVQGSIPLKCCDPPENWRAIQVGLDEFRTPESVWHVGMQEHHFCVRLVSHPRLPFWITAEWSDEMELAFDRATT